MRLYLHWPFCISRCSYCDFNTRVAGGKVMREYREALSAELHTWSLMVSGVESPLRSLYVGGGTPSTMSGEEVAELVSEAAGLFGLSDGAEVTVEVNPATWSYRDFVHARAGGVNRFSIGVQSTHDRTLHLLGRAHDAGEAMQAVENALRCGAHSVSVDLMYGLPYGDGGSLRRSLREVLELRPHHLSLYALTLAHRSPLAARIAGGEVVPAEEEGVVEEYTQACSQLRAAGYGRYEISNFCIPGHHSRHNLAYWNREEYLGVGAGAHSLLGKCRFSNATSVLSYIKGLRGGNMAVQEAEMLTEQEEREERIMLGLRTSRGVARPLMGGAEDRMEELEEGGLLTTGGGRVRLTTRGILVSNEVIARLLAA